MKTLRFGLVLALICLLAPACNDDPVVTPEEPEQPEPVDEGPYAGVPQSKIYEVTVSMGGTTEKLVVFQSSCPPYEPGHMNMEEKDQYPLKIFEGRSISWTHFPLSGAATVEVKVLDHAKVPGGGSVAVLPSRHGVTPTVSGDVVTFTLTKPGQFSVEIGEDGYKNGLMIFADPPETDIPDSTSTEYAVLQNAKPSDLKTVSPSHSGLYFSDGVHDIGVYEVPANIKNIYLAQNAWVYGALRMDNNPGVRIFGRGVLSSARLDYREAHCIEAINQSNNIVVEGIVVADPKHFAVRLIGQNNTVKWTKVIGGWVYNCDGIAAYAGSDVSNCFIWANDDAIKVYRDDITWSDIVVWQLNNGGVIQMSWGGSNASNVSLKRIDVLHAEWNKPGFNRALLSCVGNRYQSPGKYGLQKDWLIEDVVTETPIAIIFNMTPDPFSANHIHNLTLKNWDVRMTMGTDYENAIIGNDPDEPFDGFLFDNVVFNDVTLTEDNWVDVTETVTDNLAPPSFK